MCSVKSERLGALIAIWALVISRVATADAVPARPEGSGIVGGLAATPAIAATASEIPFVAPHAHAVETPSAVGAWGGARTGKEPTLSDRVVQYNIEAKLDPVKHVVDGKEVLTWRNRSDTPIRTVYVHLYLNAFSNRESTWFSGGHELGSSSRPKDGEWGWIDLVRVRQGERDVSWRYVHPDGGPDADHTVARLDLPEAVPPGGTTTLAIEFHDQMPRFISHSGWWGTFHMASQWFPQIGVLELPGERGATATRWNVHEYLPMSEFYADWGAYDVRMIVPPSYQVASTGQEQGAPIENDGWATHHFVQDDIHDFAWMAAADFAPPLVKTIDLPGGDPVTVRVYYPPEYAASAQPALQAVSDSIEYFSKTLGRYPYRTSTCVIPPFNANRAGGMEYETFFIVKGSPSITPGTLDQFLLDFTAIHEFGHGYFYGILASNEAEEPLLDEGLNEYWDDRMLRARNEPLHATTPLLKAFGVDVALPFFDFEHLYATVDPYLPDAPSENAWNRLSFASYNNVYSLTATVMHDLEERIGHDAVERSFRAYYQRWAFRHPSVADFRQVLEEVSGDKATVDDVFERYIYGAEVVDDRVSGVSSEELTPMAGSFVQDQERIEVTRGAVDEQVDDVRHAWKRQHAAANPSEGGPYPFRTIVEVRRNGSYVPQTVQVEFEDGSTERVAWDEHERWHRFRWIKSSRATVAKIDPEGRYLLDRRKLNDVRTREADSTLSRRLAGYVGSAFEILSSLMATL